MSIPRLPEALLVLLLAVPVGAPSAAADVDADAAQRERIERERAQVERENQAAQVACASQFAVTACVDRAKAERRKRLQELDRQRAILDDEARKRRAAERIERIRERQAGAADAQPPVTVRARLPAVDGVDAVGQDRAASAVNGAPATPPAAAASAALAAREAAATQAEASAARRAAAAAGRASAAAAHRRAVEKRNEERARKGRQAAPLPVPGAASRVLP